MIAIVHEDTGYLSWILPASLAAHVALFVFLPAVKPGATSHIVSTIEVASVPEPAPEPPPKAPEPDPAPAKTVAAVAHAPAPAKVANAAPNVAPSAEPAPLDFTSTVFTNDGPGVAVGNPGPVANAKATPSAKPTPTPPVADPLVPVGELSRRPVPPSLEGELEKNYPREAKSSSISGNAVLRLRILPNGQVTNVRVTSETWHGFGAACERTVRAKSWQPPLDRNGTAVATEITYTCRFEVRS